MAGETSAAPERITSNLAALALGVLRRTGFRLVAAGGGDTCLALLRALGAGSVFPVGELLPGIPLSMVKKRNIALVSKSGGFGDERCFVELRDRIAGLFPEQPRGGS